MTQQKLTETVGWAEVIPFCDRVLKKEEINQCCRERKDGAASVISSIPLSDLLARIRLEALDRGENDQWGRCSIRELAQSILATLHRPLGIHILNAETLVEMIEASHSRAAGETVRQLRAAFTDFRRELIAHLFLEEDVLFPWIFSGNGWSALELIDDLRNQHKILAVKIKTVSLPAIKMAEAKNTCEGCLALCATLKKVETVLLDHIHMEDNLLFPRALLESTEVDRPG